MRLAATARITGRGGLRNCRHRTSSHDRRWTGGVTGEVRVAASRRDDDRQVPPGRKRLRGVGGEETDALEEALQLLLARPEPDADPQRVDERQGASDRE